MNYRKQSCLYMAIQGPRRISMSTLVVLAVTVCLAQPGKAELKGDPELFKLTAMTHKHNREQILSWKGFVHKEDAHSDANGITHQEKSSIPFLFDKEQNAVRWKLTQDEVLEKKECGLIAPDRPLGFISGIIRGEAYYKYWPSRTTQAGERKNSLVIWPRTTVKEASYTETFHPMWYLTGHMTRGLDDMVERLMFFYRDLTNPALSNATITRKGDLVILVLVGREGELVNKSEFDLSKGGNIIKYCTEYKRNMELRQWTYEQIEGIWITKTFTFEHRTPDVDHQTRRTMKVIFSDNRLNEAISPSEFMVEKLGIHIGDPVTDRIMNQYYRYDGRLGGGH
jgi:hypothetical protein